MIEQGGRDAAKDVRPMIYCIVPAELAAKVHDPLRRHFSDDRYVEVVVEQRAQERRRLPERRVAEETRPAADERRLIRNLAGRRIDDRRAPAVETVAPALPRRFKRYAEQIAFVERLEPSSQHQEDVDTVRLVLRVQGGDPDAFAVLYTRYFDRVYNYLRLALRDAHEAEDATQQVFMRVFESLPRYEHRKQPFRVWLFVVVRNHALDSLRRQARLRVIEPTELAERYERQGSEERLEALSWITDRELLLFVERLPLPQRQVLVLRYMLDLTHSQVAEILQRSPEDVRVLQYRALGYLRQRLAAVGRGPEPGKSIRMRRGVRKAPVLRARRFALHL